MDFELFLLPLITAGVGAIFSYARSRKAKSQLEALDESAKQRVLAIADLAADKDLTPEERAELESEVFGIIAAHSSVAGDATVVPPPIAVDAEPNIDEKIGLSDQLTAEVVRGVSLEDVAEMMREVTLESEERQRIAQKRSNWITAAWTLGSIVVTSIVAVLVTWFFTANAELF